ncbi:Kelch-like protein 5, partial [Stegodyphus mimosarum]
MELYQVAHNYIMDHFMDVISCEEYLILSANGVKKLLGSDMLNVPSEEKAFESLMAWINYDLPNRKKDLPSLLELIRLPLLSPQFLTDFIETNAFLQEDPACCSLIMEAMKYHLLPERRSLPHASRTRPRKSTVGSLFIVGGMDGNKGSWSVEKYDLRSNKWFKFDSMTSRRLQFGAAVIDNKLYIVGGRDGLKTLNIVECYDFQTMTWTGLPSMSTHR